MTPVLCLCGCGQAPAYNTRTHSYSKYVNEQHRYRHRAQRQTAEVLARKTAQPAPLCGCGCGTPTPVNVHSRTGYLKYADATHRRRAEDAKKAAIKQTGIRRCACGCGQRVFHQRRYVNDTHKRQPTTRTAHPAHENLRVPGDLTSAQIEAIIAHHRHVLRYERNRQ